MPLLLVSKGYWSTSWGREKEVTRRVELGAEAVRVEGAAPRGWKKSVTKRSGESGCSVAQYTERVLGLLLCGCAVCSNLHCAEFKFGRGQKLLSL